MAARTGTVVLLWAAFCLPAWANVAATAGVNAVFSAANNRMLGLGENGVCGSSGSYYDCAGNLVRYGTDLSSAKRLFYDGENRLVEVQSAASATQATYAYDGDGRRVRKVAEGRETIFGYDATGGLAVETVVSGSTADWPACSPCYLVGDHLGSTRVMTAADGTVVKRTDYLPFGEELGADVGRTAGALYLPVNGVRQLFTGKERDAETGLDYFGARYMASAQGRFTSPDPLLASGRTGDPQSWNRYAYVRNNPLALVDPTGLDWVSTGNASNPYSWVDQCPEGQVCQSAVAANVGGNLRVYGSFGDWDVFDVAATSTTVAAPNRNLAAYGGEYDLVNISFLFTNLDAKIADAQNVRENYMTVDAAAALFNAGVAYAKEYPKDDKLGFVGSALGTGVGSAAHPLHRGDMADMQYMSAQGRRGVLIGSADAGRSNFLADQLAGSANSPFQGFLTSNPARFGEGSRAFSTRTGHHDHMHFWGRRYDGRMR